MRQEQITRDGKSHQANLIEKRKLLKERRILQHKRSPAGEEPDSTGTSANTSLTMDKRVNLPRRTEYINTSNKSSSPVSEEAQNEMALSSNSPSRGGANRLSKMQRMQKMKGIDHSKKATTGRPSVAASTVSTATTAVAQNSGGKPFQVQRRQKQTNFMQTRAKRVSAISHKPMPATPDTSVSSVNIKQANAGKISPQPTSRSFMHPADTSPNSDFDDAYGATDHSVEPTTDDEATLTSVRRIMTRENNDSSPRDKSHHYHHLQAQSTRGDDSMRSGRTMQPSPYSQDKSGSKAPGHARKRTESRKKWPQEEKSEKAGIPGVFRVASSSDYDTDGDISKTSRRSNALDGPSHSQATDVNEFFTQSGYAQAHRRMDDDDRTFDYGDRDDDSNGSASFAVRQRRLADPSPPEPQPSTEGKETKQTGPSSLINKDDVEHYTRSLGSPAIRVGAGVVGAITVGCLILGPAGLLAGAAVVGLGVGVMQIPEEERQKLQTKVQKAVSQAHEKAVDATESLSNSCAATYEESGVAEHLPPCLALPSADNAVAKDQESTKSEKRKPGRVADESMMASKGVQKTVGPPPTPSHETAQPRMEAVSILDRPRNKRVACLRNVRILPPGQIHGLDPSAQPKAWLDVVASANTSEEEKAEAMEEILILAKDKRRARIFLEEGILDSLIWTLDRYFEKVHSSENEWTDVVVPPGEKRAVKLAATCCLTLGKSHCAAIHTEGDLQLMSLYERGTVPEERQVAQMLHEIPHHVRITKVSDPKTFEPTKEVFALRQLSLQQAEDLARSIKAVIDGHDRF